MGMNVSELSLKSEYSGLQIDMLPQWEDAVVNSNIRTTTIEIPLMGRGSFRIMTEENRSKYEAGDKRYATSLTRLVIQTNRHTGQQIGFLMTISPSAECLKETGFNPFDELWYMNVPKNYSGHIIYHDLSGKFANGWEYRNGKLKYAINRTAEADNSDPVTRSMSLTCYTVTESVLWEICTDYYSPNGNYLGTYCEYEWETYQYEYCEYNDDDSGNDTEADNGGGGGGSGGGYNPPPPSGPQTPDTRTDCPPSATANGTRIDSVMTTNDPDYNSAVMQAVQPYIDTLRQYADTASIEYGLTVSHGTNFLYYFIAPQNNNKYIKSGTVDSISVAAPPNTYLTAHTHPSVNNSAPSPLDAISVAYNYKNQNCENITANVIFAADGSEYMVYVNDRDLLAAFCNNASNGDFFKPNGGLFKSGSQWAQTYNTVRNYLTGKNYSQNDAQSYALSYVLDYYNTGLKIYEKKSGTTAFKEQLTEKSNNKYTPKICN
jgi:hypothetical protein